MLDYKAILNLYENEMMSIKLFRICKESMIIVENLEVEKWYEIGDTVPVIRSSHRLVQLSSSWISPKLRNKDKSYAGI